MVAMGGLVINPAFHLIYRKRGRFSDKNTIFWSGEVITSGPTDRHFGSIFGGVSRIYNIGSHVFGILGVSYRGFII